MLGPTGSDVEVGVAAFLITGNPSNADRNEAQIILGRPVFEQEMRSAGAVVLDGRLPIPSVVDRILHDIRVAEVDPP